MWFDNFYRDSSELVRSGLLSQQEATVLDRFSDEVHKNYPPHSELPTVDINKLQSI